MLVVKDVATSFASVYPAARLDSDEVIEAIQEFDGDGRAKSIYSENGEEYIDACRYVRHPHLFVERRVQYVLGGMGTL